MFKTRTRDGEKKQRELRDKLEKLENVFDHQLVEASKNARKWKTPYRCSNSFTWERARNNLNNYGIGFLFLTEQSQEAHSCSKQRLRLFRQEQKDMPECSSYFVHVPWWFIDRADSWLNDRLEVHRWLNLPDKVFVENRDTVQPQWVNRLKSELGNSIGAVEIRKISQEGNKLMITKTICLPGTDSMYHFLPVNKETLHFNFACFAGSFFPKANMKKVELRGADLNRADLQGVNFVGANLQGARLYKARLQGVDLSFANLRGVILTDANLEASNLHSANLQDAYLRRANMRFASISHAQLQGANLNSAVLQKASIRGANLQGVNLNAAKLDGAKFFNTKLQGAVLRMAHLDQASFSSVLFDNTLILNPDIDFEKSDNLPSKLQADSESAVCNDVLDRKIWWGQTTRQYIPSVKRRNNMKKTTLPDMRTTTLNQQKSRCLLATDNTELMNSLRHVCDSVNDSTIDPLIHLRNWAQDIAQMSCDHKQFPD